MLEPGVFVEYGSGWGLVFCVLVCVETDSGACTLDVSLRLVCSGLQPFLAVYWDARGFSWAAWILSPGWEASHHYYRKSVRCRCSWLLPRLAGLFVSAQFALLGVIADSEYVDSMRDNRTSMLYANSSGPCICTIRSTAAWSTPAISLTLDSSGSFLRSPYLSMPFVLELERCSSDK